MAFASVFILFCLALAALRVLCSCDCALFIFAFSRFASMYNGDSSVRDYYRCQRQILVLRCIHLFCLRVAYVESQESQGSNDTADWFSKWVFIFLFCDLFIVLLLLAVAAAAAAPSVPSLGHKWKFIYFPLSSLIRATHVLCEQASEWESDAKSQCNFRNCLSIEKRLQ